MPNKGRAARRASQRRALRNACRRKSVRRAALAGAVVVGVCSPAHAAFAGGQADCPHGNNLASTACNNQPGVTQGGTLATFNYVSMTSDNLIPSAFIAQDLFAYGSGQGCPGQSGLPTWVEFDYVKGFNQPSGQYGLYYNNERSNVDHTRFYKAVTQDTSAHTFEIEANWPSGNWTVLLDGNTVKTYTGNPLSICQGQVGLEVANFDVPYLFANNNVDDPLKWQDLNGTWFSGWYSTSDYWFDQGCGTSKPGGGTWQPPNCLNAHFYNTSDFQNGKPSS